MGNRSKFKKKATIYKLRWQGDEELDGLEVDIRSLPISQFLEVMELSSEAAENPGKQKELTVAMFRIFASALVEWNLTDEFDGDVPSTLEGVLAQETDFIFRIFNQWQKAMSDVAEDLGKDSSSGKRFQEASLPMEKLSESLSN